MKFSLSLVFVFFLTLVVNAQTYKPFRVEVGLSFNASTDEEANNGAGGYIEPRYAVNDNLLLGFRLEGSYLSGGTIKVDFDDFGEESELELGVTRLSANLFFAEYFFSNERVRPFIGLGAGVYARRALGLAVDIGNVQIGELDESKANFGMAPRVGINAGHWRFSTSFNFTGPDIANYMGLNIGFEFGGGKKKKSEDRG